MEAAVGDQEQIGGVDHGEADESAAEDPMAMLKRAKDMLDAGLITQEDYDAVKAKALGL